MQSLVGAAAILLPILLVGSNPKNDKEFFNGKDLVGWSAADMSYWSVKNGAIVGHSDKPIKGNKFIWSEVPVGDFHLSVEVKLTPFKCNAGIQFRSVAINASGQAKGYQADAGGGLWGKIYHEHGRRKLDWNNRGIEAVKHGDWNRYEILAVGDRIWTAINGTLRAAIKDPAGERTGKIAFQIHGGPPQTVLYRNPTLTHNPTVELAEMNEAELNAELKAPVDLVAKLAAIKAATMARSQQGPGSFGERPSLAKVTDGKPNVLFIAIDDLRPELGCYGVGYIQSPRIDAFAKTARLFQNHYVTAPSCGPSRYALLTGLSPRQNHDASNHAFKKNVQFTAQRSIESFPHLFKEDGYETISIGKICHGSQDILPRSWTRILRSKIKHPEFQGNSGKNQRHAALGLDLPDAAYQDGAMTDTVIETLRTLKDKPFFFAVGFVKPHLPFWAPKKYFDLYDPAKIPHPVWEGMPESPSFHGSFELKQQYGHHPENFLEDADYRRKLKHGYAACVSFVDTQIGRILDEVKALDLDKNTIIVLWGDHGWHLGEHHLFGKHSSFERALKSVLVVQTPAMKHTGKPTRALVQSLDIYPTLAELCGLTPPDDLGGRSFVDLLENPDLAGPEFALSYNLTYGITNNPSFKKNRRLYAVTMRTMDYRYTQWQQNLGQGEIIFQELFDHRIDPDEKNNLAQKNPELLKSHSKLLTKYQSK
jgi:arylsulfatase A-like enzyme